MIAAETIDRVREEADIVSVIGEHVKLRRTGADYRGPCPFHGGKNPNFSVSAKNGFYHCFKCGVSGDAIGFVREHLGMDFVEAVKYVAERSGIAVVETVFTIPGLGRLLVDAIFARDYPVIQGCMLFVAFTYVLVNLVVDLCYPIFDPRVTAE